MIPALGGDYADPNPEEVSQLGAHPLDTEARLPQAVRATHRAGASLLPVSATAAGQGPVPLLQDEGQVAVGAALYLPAAAAGDGGCVTQPCQDDARLPPSLQAPAAGSYQGRAERRSRAAHVYDPDHRPMPGEACGKLADALSLADLGCVYPQGGERREEEHRRPVEAGAYQRHVPHVHGKTFVTRLGPVRAVRFVHDADRTGPRQPEQGRRSGPDHDVHAPAAGSLVDGRPAPVQAAVVRGYGVSLLECDAQEIHKPFDRPYLRRQYQGLSPILQRRPYYGLDRGVLLSAGRPPQEGTAALYGAPRGP